MVDATFYRRIDEVIYHDGTKTYLLTGDWIPIDREVDLMSGLDYNTEFEVISRKKVLSVSNSTQVIEFCKALNIPIEEYLDQEEGTKFLVGGEKDIMVDPSLMVLRMPDDYYKRKFPHIMLEKEKRNNPCHKRTSSKVIESKIPLANGAEIVMQQYQMDRNYPPEIAICLWKDGVCIQDICLVRPGENRLDTEVLVWSEKDQEDYTHRFIIEQYEEEEPPVQNERFCSKWAEIRITHFDEDEKAYFVDAWTTDDDNEEGSVIAKIYPESKIVKYLDPDAITDQMAQREIQRMFLSECAHGA